MIPSSSDDRNLTFIEHLEELRVRLIISIAAIVLASIGGYFFAPTMISIIKQPIDFASIAPVPEDNVLKITVDENSNLRLGGDVNTLKKNRDKIKEIQFIFEDETKLRFAQGNTKSLYAFRLTDKFILRFKAAFILGIIFAMPIILWQAWLFLTPALMPKERKAILPMTLTALILFPIGAAFAFYVMRYAVNFLLNFAFQDIMILVSVSDYVSFALLLMLGFGLVFELPVVAIILAKIGLINDELMRKYRGHAYVLLMVISAVMTPPDVFTMIIMAGPLVLLYEVSIYLAKMFGEKELIYERYYQD